MGDYWIIFILGTPVAFASYCAILYDIDKKRKRAEQRMRTARKKERNDANG